MLVEQLADVGLLQMDGRQHDVAGGLASQLYDPLAQVGVDHLDAMPLQERIEMAFFGEHRLALDHLLSIVAIENVEHDLVVLGRVAGPVHGSAQSRGVRFELFQIVGQPRNDVGLDRGRALAKLFPLGERLGRLVPLRADEPQRRVVPVRSGTIGHKRRGSRRMIDVLRCTRMFCHRRFAHSHSTQLHFKIRNPGTVLIVCWTMGDQWLRGVVMGSACNLGIIGAQLTRSASPLR